MIRMFCDQCEREIDEETNGGVRVKTGNREMVFHLCYDHQLELRAAILDSLVHKPKELK